LPTLPYTRRRAHPQVVVVGKAYELDFRAEDEENDRENNDPYPGRYFVFRSLCRAICMFIHVVYPYNQGRYDAYGDGKV
jgi:hypothetical protein